MNSVTQISFGMVNAFLVAEQGLIWVDTGVLNEGKTYNDVFSQLRINPQSIALILITHGHVDHFAHIQELKELTGAPVACHRNALNAVKAGISTDIAPCNELGRKVWEHIKASGALPSQSIEPDILLDAEFDLRPFGISGQVIATPGHTNCSVSVLLDSGEAIVGDMLVASPINGKVCTAYFAVNEVELFVSLRTIIPKAEIFYGGHGGPFTRSEVEPLISAYFGI